MGTYTIGEKLKIIMDRQHINMTKLSELTGQSRQNLSNKFSRDNFTEDDLRKLSSALGCEFDVRFTLPDGTEI